MDKLDIIVWMMGVGFTVMFSLLGLLWHSVNHKFEEIEKKFDKVDQKFDKVDQRFDKVDQRFDKMTEIITDMDRRLCRLEGAFASKDCCMIKDSNAHKSQTG